MHLHRRLAYQKGANLWAFGAFAALNLAVLRGADFLVLAGMLGYVALSSMLPSRVAIRRTAAKYWHR